MFDFFGLIISIAVLKDKISLQHEIQNRIIRILEEFIVDIIYVIAFNMNPRITEVTLDSSIRIS